MSAVDTLSPVCVDVAREAPETLKVSDPLSGASVTPIPSAQLSLHREEQWTFALIALFAAMLTVVAMQPTSARRTASRSTGVYAEMDASAHVITAAR